MKTINDLRKECSVEAVRNVAAARLREGSPQWLAAYETELTRLLSAAMAREGIPTPRCADVGAEAVAACARRGIRQGDPDFANAYALEFKLENVRRRVEAEQRNKPPEPPRVPPAASAPAPIPFRSTNAVAQPTTAASAAQKLAASVTTTPAAFLAALPPGDRQLVQALVYLSKNPRLPDGPGMASRETKEQHEALDAIFARLGRGDMLAFSFTTPWANGDAVAMNQAAARILMQLRKAAA